MHVPTIILLSIRVLMYRGKAAPACGLSMRAHLLRALPGHASRRSEKPSRCRSQEEGTLSLLAPHEQAAGMSQRGRRRWIG